MPTIRSWTAHFVFATAVLFFFAAATAAPSAAPYTIAPAPSWINALHPRINAPVPQEDISNGEYYLLSDRQIRISGDTEDFYMHSAVRVVNQTGVDANSQLNLSVDPNTEHLVIHEAVIRRGERRIDQLTQQQIRVLAEETELDRQLYNGRLSINILVHDLRVGDVLEYSYTSHISNPLFGGKFAESIVTRWSVPVLERKVRLLYPKTRTIAERMSGPQPEPIVRFLGDDVEKVWEWSSVQPLRLEKDRPRWHQQSPYMQFSEWTSWSEVAQWATRLYEARNIAGPLVRHKAAELAAKYAGNAERVRAVLEFVQNEIRYTGIEIGRGSHEPAEPDTVLKRSFGDCKDKSLLMVALLHELGIEAVPALVNTELGAHTSQQLPNPFAFDHVIVRAQVDGATYWLDATNWMQGGTLANVVQADFGSALPIRAQTTELENIPTPTVGEPDREVFTSFDLTDGVIKPARMTIRTVHRRSSADATRGYIASTSVDKRRTNYLNYYAASYPEITIAAPLEVHDNPVDNVLEILETYTVRNVFSKKTAGDLEFNVRADEMDGLIREPETLLRSMPLAVRFPSYIRQHIDIDFPIEWDLRTEAVDIRDPAFEYQSNTHYSKQHFTLNYDFRTLEDHVEPERVPEYLSKLKRVDHDLGYHFSYDPDAPTKVAATQYSVPIPALLTLLVSVALSMPLLWIAYRYDPLPAAARGESSQGIGGWLLLPALGALLAPVGTALTLKDSLDLVNLSQWQKLDDISGTLGMVIRPLLLLDLAGGFLLTFYSICVLILFFKRRSSAPLHFCILLWAAVACEHAGSWLAHEINDAPMPSGIQIAVWLLRSGFWTLYMMRSQRVRSTFVRRLADRRGKVLDSRPLQEA